MSLPCELCRDRGNGTPPLAQPTRKCAFCRGDVDLCKPCQQLADAANRVQSARKALQSALAHKRQLETEFNQRNDPFARLPIEVIGRIFGMIVPGYGLQGGTDSKPNYTHPQITLGAVCRAWRHLVWTTPLLWRSIGITLRRSTTHSRIALTEEWLARTADLELVIGIQMVDGWDDCAFIDSIGKIMDPLVDLMNSVAHRWAVFHALVPGRYISHLKAQGLNGPPLQNLCIQQLRYERLSSDEDAAFDLGVDVSPSVATIYGFRLQNLRVNWLNLRDFVGQDFTIEECVELLHKAPLLEECELSWVFSDRGILPQHWSPFVHNRIKTLDVSEMPITILNGLTLPSLRRLRCNLGGEQFMQTVGPFVRRSACPIEVAEFDQPASDDHDLLQLLRMIPSLKCLDILAGDIHQEFLLFLGGTAFTDAPSQQFLPNLQTLKYYGSASFPWSALAAVTPPSHPSRPNMTRRPLNHIHFQLSFLLEETPNLLDQQSLEMVLKMRDAGVEIEIIDGDEGWDIVDSSIAHHSRGSE